MVPWATRIHTGWLLWHLVACVGYAALAPAASLPGIRGDLMTLLVVATVVSQFGHVGLLRARVLSYLQISNVQAINRQVHRDEVRLQRVTDSVEKTARTDELTGLGNRLSLRLALVAARARIARHRERFAILMMDLDRFKAINDDLGHMAGDEVLQRSAALLNASVRPEDGVYRFGGEEFVAIMKVGDPAGALGAAERLRSALEGLDLPNPGNPPSGVVTISIGIAVVGPDDLGAEDDEWLVRADAALYRAKAYGRNRCELEIPPSHQPASPDGAVGSRHQRQVAGLPPPQRLASKV
jgi:two-component system chemotaxis family response regulator WspR